MTNPVNPVNPVQPLPQTPADWQRCADLAAKLLDMAGAQRWGMAHNDIGIDVARCQELLHAAQLHGIASMDSSASPCLRGESPFAARVAAELARARTLWPALHTLHEGAAVIREEFDEFWAEVKRKPGARETETLLKELVQVAAMCQRTAEDLPTLAALLAESSTTQEST